MGEYIFVFVGHFAAGKRRAVDTVPAGSSADHDNQVSGLRILETFFTRDQPDVAAEHQRVGQIPVVKIQRPVHRRNTHAVAVIPHARDHAFHNPPGMQYAFGHLFQFHIRPGKTENIRIGHRFGAHAGSHRVADHTTDAGCRPAVGVQRGRVIMRFNLKAHRMLVVKFDHAGVIFKDRNAPVFIQILSGLEDRFFDQIVKMNFFAVMVHIHTALERLMNTVLAPGLGQRLQFHVRRFPVNIAILALNCLHFLKVQEQVLRLAELHELLVAQFADRDFRQLHLIRLGMRTWRLGIHPKDHVLDAVIGQRPAGDGFAFLVRNSPQQNILTPRPHRSHLPGPHIRQRRADRFGHRVRHAAFEMNLDQRRLHRSGGNAAFADVPVLADRIGQ